MSDFLFQESISAFAEQNVYQARIHTEQLTQEQLEGANLSTTLDAIAKVKFEVAKLKPDERRGKRRTEKRNAIDYGRQVTVDLDMIDVTIPFEGWPKSFTLAPSSHVIIDTPAKITHERVILVSLPDDQNLDRNVDRFIQQVTQNLDSLARDLKNIEGQMLQVAQVVANQRIKQNRERRERDKTRSFPIE